MFFTNATALNADLPNTGISRPVLVFFTNATALNAAPALHTHTLF
jgi:hypothetical protein